MASYVDATYESRISGLDRFRFKDFVLNNGEFFGTVDVAYKTYGKLNADKSNAIFVCHSLSGDCHVSGKYPNSEVPGWWSSLVGPGKYVDTDKYFIVCPNIFGGCYGTTGPSSINPKTGRPYGPQFPKFSVKDIVACHQKVLEHLGIKKARAVFGGSFGGNQVLQWMASFPETLEKAVPMATSAATPALVVASQYTVKKILENDAAYMKGHYYEKGQPVNATALSRLALELQFVSSHELQKSYGRKKEGGEFVVAKSIWEKSMKFAKRFDANSFLFILNAIDNLDLGQDATALKKSFSRGDYEMLGIAVSSDTLYPSEEMKKVVEARRANGKNAKFYELQSPEGHDAFFTEINKVGPEIKKFIDK